VRSPSIDVESAAGHTPRHRAPGRRRWPTGTRGRRHWTALALVPLLAVAAGVVFWRAGGTDRNAAEQAPPAGIAEAPAGVPPCTYEQSEGEGSAELPPGRPQKAGLVQVTVHTTHGELKLELDADRAPCTVNSFVALAADQYFDSTPCHRLTTAAIFVLQCGDPTATGTGGPGSRFPDENLPVGSLPAYPRGTLAMANAGPGTNGSQFFLVYKDSDIDPNYPVFGKVTAGLDILDKIAASGAPNNDGPPNLEIIIDAVEVS
jgi:peptidyl-prolyl cis-trans isomerase B (cyclophilin B)